MATKFLYGMRKILFTRNVFRIYEPSALAQHLHSNNPKPPHIMQEKKSWRAPQVILFLLHTA